MDNFDQFCADYHVHFSVDANARIYLGIDRDLDQLPDPSLEAEQARLRSGCGLLQRIPALLENADDFDRSLDLDLARLSLDEEQFLGAYQFNGRSALQQTPCAGDDIGGGMFQLFVTDPRQPEIRLQEICGRIEAVPEYLESLTGRLDTPVARWVDMDLEQVRELPALFENICNWAGEVQGADVQRLQLASKHACQALDTYQQTLAAMPTAAQFHIGADCAQQLVRHTGLDYSLDQLHDMATEFLAETNDILEQLRGVLCHKYGLPARTSATELHGTLKRHFRPQLDGKPLDSILDLYRESQAQIIDFISERELFPIFAEQEIQILRTPGFLEPTIPAGAMNSPPPFREGLRTSVVFLTLSDELIDEHSLIDIPGMMMHEGIPGHHLQLATASLHPSVIRRHFGSNAHAEGWTTMLEDYMLDVGIMAELTDEARFCGKRDISRIGARVAIDLYFMTGDKSYLDVGIDCDLSSDDPFVAAGNLLQTVTGFTDARVQGELNWYSLERGYPLSYLAGNRAVWALKGELERAQQGRMSKGELDHAFHRVYLESGNMPVSFLSRVFQHQGLM